MRREADQAPETPGNAHPNQIGQPGGDRKRRRRNAIYPSSAEAAVIEQARTTFLLGEISSGVQEVALNEDNVASAAQGDSELDAAGVSGVSEVETPVSALARRGRRSHDRQMSADDTIEVSRLLVSPRLLGWGSYSEVDMVEVTDDNQL